MSGTASAVCRVIVADDHVLFRAGVVQALAAAGGFEVVAEAGDGMEAVSAYRAMRPDLLLLDLEMPKLTGVEAVRRIRAEDADAKVLILTTFDIEEEIEACLRAGAKGYLLKETTPDELVRAMRDVSAGRTRVSPDIAARLAERLTRPGLTMAEFRVLKLVTEGLSNKAIGERMNVSEGTVKVHLTHVLDKLGATSRTEAAAIAQQRGLVRVRRRQG